MQKKPKQVEAGVYVAVEVLDVTHRTVLPLDRASANRPLHGRDEPSFGHRRKHRQQVRVLRSLAESLGPGDEVEPVPA